MTAQLSTLSTKIAVLVAHDPRQAGRMDDVAGDRVLLDVADDPLGVANANARAGDQRTLRHVRPSRGRADLSHSRTASSTISWAFRFAIPRAVKN